MDVGNFFGFMESSGDILSPIWVVHQTRSTSDPD
jgi:hypothetical protein